MDRPVEILYVRADGLAMGHPEGSPKQLAKEADSKWSRVFKPLVEREKEWDETIKARKQELTISVKSTKPKKVTKRKTRKKRTS